MFEKRWKIIITLIINIILIFGCLNKTEGLKKTDINPIIEIFLSRHVKYNRFDDEISKKTLDNFLNNLDPGKYYFHKSDIENLSRHRTKIDDYVREEKYDFIFEIFQLYKKRFAESLKIFHTLIERKYNFKKEESIPIDRKTIDYPKDENQKKERWRKNIKLQLLNQLPAVKNIDEAKKKIKKKYILIEKRINEINVERMISTFVNSFSTALDPHSNYLRQEDHEDFMISTKLKLEGIGVLLRSEDGFVKVESIITGGAAAKLPKKLKLQHNDKIVSVAQSKGEFVDVIDMALRDVVKLIRGEKGTKVRLAILREAEDTHKQLRLIIPIIREEIKLQDRAARSDIYTITNKNSKINIGYIKLPTFYLDFDAIQENDPDAKSSSRDVTIQINKLKKKGIDCIVLDLRGNPGGALTEAISLAGLFIDQGPVLQIMGAGKNIRVMSDEEPGVSYDGPLVVLIDKFSASASEIFAGAIKDYRRGLLIGASPTFGKGSVQTYNVLPGNKGAMKITTALFYQPAGTSNQLGGIRPDVSIPDLSSVWDIGEDQLRNPLQWERIVRASFIPYRNYLKKNTAPSLTIKSGRRVKVSKKFGKLVKKIEKYRKKLQRKEISLKEEAGLNDQKRKEIEKKMRNNNENILINLKEDLFLDEAFKIAVDYIKLLKK